MRRLSLQHSAAASLREKLLFRQCPGRSYTGGKKAPSPRVQALRRAESKAETAKHLSREPRVEPRNWPMQMLNAAFEAGKLPVSPWAAISMLDDFANLVRMKTLTKANSKQILKDHEIEPKALTTLAKILLRSGNGSLAKLALDLLVTSSRFEDEDASMILVEEGLKHGASQDLQNPKLQDAIKHLHQLAEANNPLAMVLVGRMMELFGDARGALKNFRGAIVAASATPSAEERDYQATLSEAWESIARLENGFNNPTKELEALAAAALQHDNPRALYELALRKEKESPTESSEYLRKAAVSGIGDAAFKIGLSNAVEIDVKERHTAPSSTSKNQRQSAPSKQYRIVEEWFLIAAESESCNFKGQAKLHSARAMRKTGQLEKSRTRLESALELLQLQASDVRLLRANWMKPEFDLSTQELQDMITLRSRGDVT